MQKYNKESSERPTPLPYREAIYREYSNPTFWELYRYDFEGNLVIRSTGIKVVDLLKRFGDKYGAPIQITDATVVERRARDIKSIVENAAREANYPLEKIEIGYASKANLKRPVVEAAIRELNYETSGPLDLENYLKLISEGVVGAKDKRMVICNGFKGGWRGNAFDRGYAQRTIDLHKKGVNITVVLDQNELPFYARQRNLKESLSVGLRLKFGKVQSEEELSRLVNRFGFNWDQLLEEAVKIEATPHLKLTMLHAMVSAAEKVDPREFTKYHLFAAEKYMALKKAYPNLKYLNIGGGLPPLGLGYDYKAFLVPYLSGVKEIAIKNNVELPTIILETGSFIASDAESLAYRVLEYKSNNLGPNGAYEPWAIINGVLMANIPDMLFTKSDFAFVAATNANEPVIYGRVGDVSCDSDGVFPPKIQPGRLIALPQKSEDLVIFVVNTGAYQDILGAIGDEDGAEMILHCGNPEPISVTIGLDYKGKVFIEGGKRLALSKLSRVAGYGRK